MPAFWEYRRVLIGSPGSLNPYHTDLMSHLEEQGAMDDTLFCQSADLVIGSKDPAQVSDRFRV